jgi:hypothetical protein
MAKVRLTPLVGAKVDFEPRRRAKLRLTPNTGVKRSLTRLIHGG